MKTLNKKVKRCPLCGRKGKIGHGVTPDDEYWYGRCSDKHCYCSSKQEYTYEEALANWNKRPGEEAIAKSINKAYRALRKVRKNIEKHP